MSGRPTNLEPEGVLSGALVDVIDAFDVSITARLARIEAQLQAKANVAVSMAVLISIGLATAAVSWVSATLAIGAFVAARHGLVAAAAVVAGINIVVALSCAAVARSLSARTRAWLTVSGHE